MTYLGNLPALEDRFLPPDNWKAGNYTNSANGHNIHYNFLPPENEPKGIIVALPGLSEFGEKYIETAKDFAKHGYWFYVIDWAYQGRSKRFTENPHKRSSDGYEEDVSDLHFLIQNTIQTVLPLYMLGHSMGGNIGLRYLLEHPNTFKAASFSAPMLGIRDLRFFYPAVKIILKIIKNLNNYLPGGKDWHETARKSNGMDIFSNDPIRDNVHNAWCLSNPELQIGNPTFLWLLESIKSIEVLKFNLNEIYTPTLLAIAEHEKLVDNSAIKKHVKTMPHASLLELNNAKHEILMETDNARNKFIEETLKLFTQST